MGLFGIFSKKDKSEEIKTYLEKGAIVLDVRTQAEWDEGHVEGSKHIVLTLIPAKVEEVKALDKPIIAVCRSGGRSEQATNFLAQHGIDVINGGPWQNVAQHIE